MKTSPKNHFSRSLNQILKRYRLSETELQQLDAVDTDRIVSLA